MLTAYTVILVLKIAVAAVTVLLLLSLALLVRGDRRRHGQVNVVFFVLTMTAVLGLEVIIRILRPDLIEVLDATARANLRTHLWFSIPATILLPAMLFTGKTHRRTTHLLLSILFALAWLGTFVTGVFYLPHAAP